MDEVMRYRQAKIQHSQGNRGQYTGCGTVLETRQERHSFRQWLLGPVSTCMIAALPPRLAKQ